jgi:hypothetical protein
MACSLNRLPCPSLYAVVRLPVDTAGVGVGPSPPPRLRSKRKVLPPAPSPSPSPGGRGGEGRRDGGRPIDVDVTVLSEKSESVCEAGAAVDPSAVVDREMVMVPDVAVDAASGQSLDSPPAPRHIGVGAPLVQSVAVTARTNPYQALGAVPRYRSHNVDDLVLSVGVPTVEEDGIETDE